jgi:hypothetical protein
MKKNMIKQPTDETKIALINNNIGFIQKDLSEIKITLKEMAGVYVPTAKFDEAQTQLNYRLAGLEKSSNLWKWLAPMLSAVTGSIVTFLVISFLQNSR